MIERNDRKMQEKNNKKIRENSFKKESAEKYTKGGKSVNKPQFKPVQNNINS